MAMRPEHMKETAESLGEGFFHDRIYEVLTGSEFFKEQFPGRETEYLTRAIEFVGDAIGYCESCKLKKIPLSKLLNKDGKSIPAIYLRVSGALPKEKIRDEKTILNSLKEYKDILIKIRDKKEVSEEHRQSLIELINNMRRETLSETSALIYQ